MKVKIFHKVVREENLQHRIYKSWPIGEVTKSGLMAIRHIISPVRSVNSCKVYDFYIHCVEVF
jgi:hypothetical protein